MPEKEVALYRKGYDARSRAYNDRNTSKERVSEVVGFIKGKSAIAIARNLGRNPRNFRGENFWARGYYVTTVGLDEEVVRAYIRNQEKRDIRIDQLNLRY